MKPIPTETATDVGSVSKWLGAAAAGALLMYLLDPERGAARRSRALSAVRSAGARTGASVDHALHSAGDRLAGLKDSAVGALSRGAGRLQEQAAPVLDRARQGSHEAARRAGTARHAGGGSGHGSSYGSSYETHRDYAAASGGIAGWLRGLAGRHDARGDGARSDTMAETGSERGPHPALVGGGVLGVLSLVRRSPGGLLVGLAALALLLQGTRSRTYRVNDNMAMPHPHLRDAQQQQQEGGQAQMAPPSGESGSRYLH